MRNKECIEEAMRKLAAQSAQPTLGSTFMGYGMPVSTTARPAASLKSSPSLALPLRGVACGGCGCGRRDRAGDDARWGWTG